MISDVACLPAAHCGDAMVQVHRERSLSLGSPSSGRLLGGEQFIDSSTAHVLPRQKLRCLDWGTARLVAAIHRAGEAVERSLPGSPPLGVGDLSHAGGGPIAYSHSHQDGRDADLAFYQLDPSGRPAPAEDLTPFGDDLLGQDGKRFDVDRNWLLVRALLSDPEIEVVWIFVSNPLRAALLEEAERRGEGEELRSRAAEALHQPSDAPPHDDHLHLRISCTAEERALGCR